MRKKIFIITILILIFIPRISLGDDGESKSEEFINSQLENLNLTEIQTIINDINSTNNNFLPKVDIKGIIKSLMSGKSLLEGEDVIKGIFKLLFNEVIANSKLLIQILILSIISAILNNLQSAFSNETISKLANYVCYIVIITIVIKSFTITLTIGSVAIDRMVSFMQAILPVLITLLVLMGGITTSALLHPIIVTSVSAISSIMKDIVYPLIFFSAVIAIVNNISDKFQISKLADLLKKLSVLVIGITTTIFLGIMSVQGAAASKIDGVSIRTAKFAVDNFIPVVGKFLSDSMDTVIGYSMVLKNAIGVVGLLIIFIICLIPLIKIISLIFIYKLTAAIIQPVSDCKVVNTLEEISKSMTLILATILSVIFMFYITINIIVSAGAQTIMLR